MPLVTPPMCRYLITGIAPPRSTSWIARQRTGIVVLDAQNRILEFQEKPKEPKSEWGVPPLYLYPRETIARFREYLELGGNPDAPGNFVEWLRRRERCYAWKMNGTVVDIGNLQSLEAARERFRS